MPKQTVTQLARPTPAALRALAADLRLQAQIGRTVDDPDAESTSQAIDEEAQLVEAAADLIAELLAALKGFVLDITDGVLVRDAGRLGPDAMVAELVDGTRRLQAAQIVLAKAEGQ